METKAEKAEYLFGLIKWARVGDIELLRVGPICYGKIMFRRGVWIEGWRGTSLVWGGEPA